MQGQYVALLFKQLGGAELATAPQPYIPARVQQSDTRLLRPQTSDTYLPRVQQASEYLGRGEEKL